MYESDTLVQLRKRSNGCPYITRYKNYHDARETSYIPFDHLLPQNAGHNISLKEVKKQKIRDAELLYTKRLASWLLSALL